MIARAIVARDPYENLSLNLESNGWALVSGLVDEAAIRELRELVDRELSGGGSKAGRRNLLELSAARAVAFSLELLDLIGRCIGEGPFPVRAILFDKTPEANWGVPWHQDLMIAVGELGEAPGFSSWSLKDGVPHAQPPVRVLEGMISARIHLDDCGPGNGPLRVLPGTHLMGKLCDERIAELAARLPAAECAARAGDAVLMRPLLLHASSRAQTPARRRVLHIDFAARELPEGVQWHARRDAAAV